jgi:hypothetical protein
MVFEVGMLLRASILAVMASALVATSQSAEAGSRKRFVTPVFVPPDQVVLKPINPPLAGVFLTSPSPDCPSRTMYYFDGRFADRPDFFYIRRR